MVDFAWSHAIISDQLHANIFKQCNFSLDIENLTLSCLNYYRDFLVSYSKIDIYNIYAPICQSTSSSSFDSMFRLLGPAPRLFSKYVRPHISLLKNFNLNSCFLVQLQLRHEIELLAISDLFTKLCSDQYLDLKMGFD